MPASNIAAAHPGKAERAADIAARLAHTNVLAILRDEIDAAEVAALVAAMVPEAIVLLCPGSDALPGDAAPASPANIGQRVAALHRLSCLRAEGDARRIALISTGEAAARAYPPPDAYRAVPPSIAVDMAIDLAALHAELIEAGYVDDERVDEPGEVGLRGQVLDVFPADRAHPLRVEEADGRIVAIRRYDAGDQRGVDTIEACELGRVTEPAVGDAPVTLLDHLDDAIVVVDRAGDERRRRFLKLVADATKRGSRRVGRHIVDDAAWKAALETRETADIAPAGDPPPRFVESAAPLRACAKLVRAEIAQGNRVALLGGERDIRFLMPRLANAVKLEGEALANWAALEQSRAPLCSLPVRADRGFRRDGLLVIAAADLIGSRAERGDAASASIPAFDAAVELRVGDVVIHEDHGLAVVDGVRPLPGGDGEDAASDAIALTYAGDAIRLVPVSEADRIWRYGAEADAVRLDKLDGSTWQKRRRDIDAAIAETARGLTAIAAERAERSAPVLDPKPADYESFAAGFPYSETPDQQAAIEAVRADLASGRPMDRLIVGDVGFGKTEVALRAAAIAALSGRQVAIVAPTTVLARQHLESVTQRFEDSGITVAGLSRLSSAAEKRAVKAGLKDGSVRIVVGTGAIAAKDVRFKQLALVIVDEEQRFGAADKKRLEALSAGHVLSMTATPIPRTLQAAMVGLRQLSVIATPPARRQPIRTAIGAFDKQVLRAALLREKSRGGQSFVVVPRIADMAPLAAVLAESVPELEVLTAHGKLPAAEIDEAMVRFGAGEGDVLLATNIIETGLDVPRANTMAILHADRFGIAQLHQLRGRVGRGGRRGQVLLFTKGEGEIAPRTLKRLRTLETFDRLGAGFAISASDLDLRGAGDLLGDTQAGHMRLIGVELYQQLLEGALRTARGERVERWSPELNLGAQGNFPESWVPDADTRITLYARLARIGSFDALDDFEREIEDRFGTPPPAATRLLASARIRLQARALDIERIDAGPAAIAFAPRGDAAVLAEALELGERNGRVLLDERIDEPDARFDRVRHLLDAATE
ncbi:helicase-related protein [Sphingomonas baiyangensis]|uniref:Transcription-repair-coupling factor n=1 Tax=Sphingomonas baiyangensis TaxID=2572576 RepID=A0A4V5PUG0_9SPHN|nr:helicase-related protein [Sphingomonas baiyangensis]TKD50118.1 DEAD/DEAH box helicase [Sphingomonas baiyangensis]